MCVCTCISVFAFIRVNACVHCVDSCNWNTPLALSCQDPVKQSCCRVYAEAALLSCECRGSGACRTKIQVWETSLAAIISQHVEGRESGVSVCLQAAEY